MTDDDGKLTDESAHRVVEICEALDKDVGQGHRTRWYRARSLYEGQNIFDDAAPMGAVQTVELDVEDPYNLSRSAVDTAHAEIAARQRPKPMFVTSGGDWRTKRKAKKWDRFVEGCLNQRQGDRYADAWELGEDCFRDAECAVAGVAKVSVDRQLERINFERIPAYEVKVDPQEARGGRVRNWFHDYPMDLDLAEGTFAGEEDMDTTERQRILMALASAAGSDHMSSSGASWRATQSVRIYEAWYVSPILGKPGKHIFACRGGLLFEEDWEWPRAPFAILTWSKEAFGVWGVGLVEAGRKQHELVNDMQERLHTRMKLNAVLRTYYNADVVRTEELGKNDAEVFIPVKDMAQAPRSEQVPPVTPAETEYVAVNIQRYYDFAGVSQMSATQRKEPGVDAAIAMQTLNDIKSVRFLPKARAYELFYVSLGELTVYAARDLAATNPKFTARWFGSRKQYDEIKWKDIDLDVTPECRVAPVSAMSRDPAQRLQIVEQIVNMGFLSRERYFELIGLPDLDSVLQMEGSETQWVEKMCDRYLDAKDDDELEKLGGYQEPDGYLIQPLNALITTAQHYFDARVNDVPEYNAELLIRFMTSLQRIIQAAPGQAAAQGAAPAQPVEAIVPPPAAMPQQMGAAA